jgi:ABC-type Fe3+-citrate transport system substrate-binding protein
VYEVDDDVWASSIGILGANRIIDDLLQKLAT